MSNVNDSLELELKRMIIDVLSLEDIGPEKIDSHEPLFGEGLGLDSIDALELGVAIRQRYGIKITKVSEDIKTHFSSVHNLANFISLHREAK